MVGVTNVVGIWAQASSCLSLLSGQQLHLQNLYFHRRAASLPYGSDESRNDGKCCRRCKPIRRNRKPRVGGAQSLKRWLLKNPRGTVACLERRVGSTAVQQEVRMWLLFETQVQRIMKADLVLSTLDARNDKDVTPPRHTSYNS